MHGIYGTALKWQRREADPFHLMPKQRMRGAITPLTSRPMFFIACIGIILLLLWILLELLELLELLQPDQ